MSEPALLKRYGDQIGEVNFSTHVAGTTFVKGSESLLRYLKSIPPNFIKILLEREPTNTEDPNAVKVKVTVLGSKKSCKIGYIPKERSELLSYVLLHDDEFSVLVHDISLKGGEGDKPNIGIFFSYRIQRR